ncbi:MAG: Flp family type IVb pilin [Parvularculaceae bacterium]
MSAQSLIVSTRRRIANVTKRFAADENGATAIEYSLLIALIFLAIVTAIRNYTVSASEMYNTIDDTLQNG